MKIDTRIIDNFLSEEEIQNLEARIRHLPKYLDEDTSGNKLWKSELQQLANDDVFHDSIIETILRPKVYKYFTEDIVINQAHVLTSYIPYGIHTDARGTFGIPSKTHKAAWTFVIPLANYDSATIVFDQYGTETVYEPFDCEEKFNWTRAERIDKDIVDKYLSNLPKELLEWFTIQDIFHWKKGSNFAAPRVNFHCSDNFPAKNIPYKRAIIMWTTVPKD